MFLVPLHINSPIPVALIKSIRCLVCPEFAAGLCWLLHSRMLFTILGKISLKQVWDSRAVFKITVKAI